MFMVCPRLIGSDVAGRQRRWACTPLGRVASSPHRLVLSSTTKTRYVDGDTAPDTTVFVVTLDHGTPIEIEAIGATHALAPEP